MKTLNGGNVIRIPLDDIVVGHRLRRVSDAQVENLLLMAEDTGITTPIHVRKVDGRYELIDGAHRLEAARRLGLTEIAALVRECRQDEARAMEASNNLGAATMSPLQRIVFAASWERDYYTLHPDRKPGVFKGNRHTGKLVTDQKSVTSAMAESFGVDERHVFRMLAAGRRLSPEEIEALDGAQKPVSLEILRDLAKVSDAEERREVVQRIAAGAKSVAVARQALRAERGEVSSPPEPSVDAQFKALSTLWSRTGAAARRRFVTQQREALLALLEDGGEDA